MKKSVSCDPFLLRKNEKISVTDSQCKAKFLSADTMIHEMISRFSLTG